MKKCKKRKDGESRMGINEGEGEIDRLKRGRSMEREDEEDGGRAEGINKRGIIKI